MLQSRMTTIIIGDLHVRCNFFTLLWQRTSLEKGTLQLKAITENCKIFTTFNLESNFSAGPDPLNAPHIRVHPDTEVNLLVPGQPF